MSEAKWAVDERRLASAYEDVASGRYKSAASTVDRHLKKHPKSQPALVLKTVILERQEASEDDVLQALAKAKSTGELTGRSLWWIGITLKNLGRRDLALKLYHDLWIKAPDNIELGEQVFLHAAAAWDTEIMVQSSRKMFNKLRSPVWARVAAWSEWVKHVPHPSGQDSFTSAPTNSLLVASTLLSTTRKACDSSDILWLHLQIMISAGNLKDALSLAQSAGDEGSLARMWFRMEGVKEITQRMKGKGEDTDEAWRTEWDWVKGRLGDVECQRNYAFYRYLLQGARELRATSTSVVQETADLLESLNTQIGSKERAPSLARLELDSALSGDEALSVADWTQSAEQYWTVWGSKGSIVSELEGIVGDDVQKREQLSGVLQMSSKSYANLQEYRKVVNTELWLLRSRPSDWVSDAAYLDSLASLYVAGLQYGMNLPKTDVQPSDDIGLALVHLLVTQWRRSPEDEAPVLRAILLLRLILTKSPACKSAYLILGRLLRLLGASRLPECRVGSASKEWSEIQLDNLSHFTVDRAGVEALVHESGPGWATFVSKSHRMYRRTSTDMSDYIKQALQHESYSKIPSIRTVSSNLDHSLSRHVLAVESARFAHLNQQTIAPRTMEGLERALETELVDTRDWSLVPELGTRRGSLREALTLGSEPSGAWVKSWSGLLIRLGRLIYGSSDEVVVAPITGDLLPAESAALGVSSALVRRAEAALKGEETSAGSLRDGVAALADLAKSASGTPWDVLYPCLLFVEAHQIAIAMHEKLRVASKAAGKKAPKPSTALLELLKDVEEIKKQFKERAPDLAKRLDALRETFNRAPWDASNLPSSDSLIEYGAEVTEARVKGIERLQTLVMDPSNV